MVDFAHPVAHKEVDFQLSVTAIAWAHIGCVLVSLIAATAARQPEALVIGAPSLVILALSLLGPRLDRVSASLTIDRPRVIEGDVVVLTVRVSGRAPCPVLSVEFTPETTLEPEGPLHQVFSLDADEEGQASFGFSATEWGLASIGFVSVLQRDRFGVMAMHQLVRVTEQIRVHIREEDVRSLREPDRFRRYVGSHLSQERGDGCEIADVRPYQPGDRLQSLNWRISARREEPWITLRHPDRSTTVVVVLDAFAQVGRHRTDFLRRSVQATLGLVRLHLAAQDPVGVLIVGDGMRWIQPALGRDHQHLIADVMVELSQRKWSARPRNAELADRLVPPDAVLVAVSPLEEARFSDVLVKLQRSGRPTQVVQPVIDWRLHMDSPWLDPFAWRIRALSDEARRRRFAAQGMPVHPWEDGRSFEAILLAMRVRNRGRAVVTPR